VNVYIKSVHMQSGDVIDFDRAGVTVIAGANNCGKSRFLVELNEQLGNSGTGQRLIVGSVTRAAEGLAQDYIDWLCQHAHFEAKDPMTSGPVFKRIGLTVPFNFLTEVQAADSLSASPDSLFHIFVKYLEAGHLGAQFTASAKETVFDAPADPLHVLSDSAEIMEELNALVFKILGVRLTMDDLNRALMLRVGTPQTPFPVGRYANRIPYQTDVESLPQLGVQGDGMRSLLKILIPLVTAIYPVLIIDEPETFLHPPQAFALGQELGRISERKGIQVVLATHDRDILAGLVNTTAPSVVRLVRHADNSTKAYQLKAAELAEIWRDPILKYSRVLDGLFHKVVVLAEAERDCRFFEAALDVHQPAQGDEGGPGPLPPSEVLFIPTSGTSNMPRLAKALEQLKVPVIACPDLDVLDNESVIKNIVQAAGGNWSELAGNWKTVTAPLAETPKTQLVATVLETVTAECNAVLDADVLAKYTGDVKKRIMEALKPPSRPWDAVKHHGVNELRRLNGRNGEVVSQLIEDLEARNVVVVAVGELESFGHGLNGEKGKTWLPAALKAGLHKEPAAQEHVAKIVRTAARLTSA
jgi:hypothetical protein